MITSTRLGYNGRIGNSLFQFAALFGLRNKRGYEISIPYQNEQLGGNYYNPGTGERGSKLELRFMFKNFNYSNASNYQYLYREPHFHFDENFFELQDGTNIDGYFHSYKYFEHCEKELRQALQFNDNILERCKLPPGIKVAINVRRGDYLVFQEAHPLCTEDYFRKGLNFFPEDYVKVFISDDLEWCKETFKDIKNVFFFESIEKKYDDLCAISLCDHAIISNSSYSWWGAWLIGDNSTIIAPDRWFGPKLFHYDTKDIIPQKWIKI